MNFIFEWQKQYFTNKRSEENIVFDHKKIKFISSSCHIIFFLLYRQEYFCTNSSVKAGNDVIDILTIDILTSEDMENTPLES